MYGRESDRLDQWFRSFLKDGIFHDGKFNWLHRRNEAKYQKLKK
jgi:hypothetical protein